MCNLCKQNLHQKNHFYQCTTITEAYDHFLPILNSIYNTTLSMEEKVLGLNNNTQNKAIALRNYVSYQIRHNAHKIRFSDTLGPPQVCKNIIIKKTKNAIRKDLLYNYGISCYRGHQATTLFTNNFLINNILAHIDQTKGLVINI